ncbi:hypothetical protein HID58_061870, partial [Brassica napus]
ELYLLRLGQSLVVFEVVFLVVSLPSIVPSRLARVRLHDLMNFVLSTLPSMFPHLVAAFIAACISVTLSFAMFTTPGLDIVLLRIWKIVSGFKSGLWFLGGWLPFSLTQYKCAVLVSWRLVSSIQSFVVLHRHRRLVCACLVCEELHLLRLGKSLVVFEVVFLVVSLPSIVPSRLGFQDMVFGDINSIARVRLHDLMNFVLSTLPSMFPHLVAAFIAACISVTLSFAMFTTPGLDIVLLRVCSVDLEDCFWSQFWSLVSRGMASVLPHSGCSLLPLLLLSLGDLVSSIQSFVVLHRHRRL